MLAEMPQLTVHPCCNVGSWGVECINPAVHIQEEEVAESAAKGAQQARKKAQKSRKSAKKAVKAAAPSTVSATPEAAAAAQPDDQSAACGSGVRSGAQPTSGSVASKGAEAQPHTGSEVDNSWQLCPLTEVGDRRPAERCQ